MGSLSLNCPLCCGEEFTSYDSLKYHILSITDNLLCPACNNRFDSFLELAEHLGRECGPPEIEDVNIKPIRTFADVAIQSNLGPLETNANSNHGSDGSDSFLLRPKVELEEDNTEMNKSILAKALLGQQDDGRMDMLEGSMNPEEVQQTVYTCQMCNIDFHSIEEHLEKYHEGQEVLLETEENRHAELDHHSDGDDNDSMMILNGSEVDDMDKFVTDFEMEKQDNTVEERQCLDKDGRLYTRKVVKIDKFWIDNSNNELPEPMTEKYLLEDGQIKKITHEEADNITNKDAVIEIHQCSRCFLQFPNLEHYRKHKCNPSKAKTKFKCVHCTAVFMSYKALNTHLKAHVTVDEEDGSKTIVVGPFLCDICKTMFPSFKSLRLHKRMHDPIKEKTVEAPVNYTILGPSEPSDSVRHMFICNICNKTYDKEYEEVHMKSHTEAENFNCVICNRKFINQENLNMHIKAHRSSKNFACSYCKKRFVTYEALMEHVDNQCQKRHYECRYCGRRFARPHEKVKHERIHTGEKPHVCQICGKAFRVSYCLTLHLRTHSGTRPYQCAHCQKRFKSHSVYNHHLLTHSDVRAYKCPYCPKAFKTSVQLAGHKNSHIKPFSCTECNRPFASLYAVRAHMETHKRENNLKYDCWLCGASYARAFALRDHMKAQHEGSGALSVEDNDVLIELESAVSASQIENEMENDDMQQEAEIHQVQEEEFQNEGEIHQGVIHNEGMMEHANEGVIHHEDEMEEVAVVEGEAEGDGEGQEVNNEVEKEHEIEIQQQELQLNENEAVEDVENLDNVILNPEMEVNQN